MTTRRQRTHAAILEAAEQEIRRSGIDRFSMDAVAESVQLTKPGLYYYFKSREGLIFELLLREWIATAEAIDAAVRTTTTGRQALRTLVRTYVDRYRHDLSLFRLTHHQLQRMDAASFIGPVELERLRPINDKLYGGVEARLRADAEAGHPPIAEPRRLAFVLTATAVGVLTMISMVEGADDPLRHTDADLLDTIDALIDAATRSAA